MRDLRLPTIAVATIIAGALCWAARADSDSAAAVVAPSETGAAAGTHVRLQFPPRFWLAAATVQQRENDYPTSERADYVIGCVAANGNTREALLKCSCAIDTIAGLMPYSDYERAETALSLQLGGGVGGRVGLFRDPPQIKAVIEELRRAQAEANLQCR
jgi:hypothetical protein